MLFFSNQNQVSTVWIARQTPATKIVPRTSYNKRLLKNRHHSSKSGLSRVSGSSQLAVAKRVNLAVSCARLFSRSFSLFLALSRFLWQYFVSCVYLATRWGQELRFGALVFWIRRTGQAQKTLINVCWRLKGERIVWSL